MKRICILSLFSILACSTLFANGSTGYKIHVKLENYTANELIIGFHYGEKQYVKDTATLGADGYFTFEADTLFPSGVYLLVLKPDNNFIQILLDDKNQQITITTDAKDTVNKMKIKGSPDNEVFYEYLRYLNKQRPDADSLRAQLGRAKGNIADSIRITEMISDLDKAVKKYQLDLVAKNQGTMTAKIVKAAFDPEVPDFKGEEKEVAKKKFYWIRDHYFDNIDIADPAMLRSPVLHGKIDYFITKLTPQHPDTVNAAIDYVMGKIKGNYNNENYKYYLIHFLNYYAKSNIVGFDACYVHIANEYYCRGEASWTKKEDLEKICDNARRLAPILIGRIAPNITVLDSKEQPHSLWDVDADYTILFFWASDCGHCKKSAPHMVEVAKKFKDRGVKIFAVCTGVVTSKEDSNSPEKVHESCWKGVEEKEFSDELFFNAYDPYIRSRYKMVYDVQTTPQIFIINRNHEILMKRIGAEQLSEVMEQVISMQEEKKKSAKVGGNSKPASSGMVEKKPELSTMSKEDYTKEMINRLTSYKVGYTTLTEFLADGWNYSVPQKGKIGITGFIQKGPKKTFFLGVNDYSKVSKDELRKIEESGDFQEKTMIATYEKGGNAMSGKALNQYKIEFENGQLISIQLIK
jgi:thiol-disulfide isomerase/thioredoxin